MGGPIQFRDSSGPGSGYFDAAGENRGDGTAALLTTSGRSGSLVPIGTSDALLLKTGPGELIQVASVGAAGSDAGSMVYFFDAPDVASIDDTNMIWQGTPGVVPTPIGYPFTRGLVAYFDNATTANVLPVYT